MRKKLKEALMKNGEEVDENQLNAEDDVMEEEIEAAMEMEV